MQTFSHRKKKHSFYYFFGFSSSYEELFGPHTHTITLNLSSPPNSISLVPPHAEQKQQYILNTQISQARERYHKKTRRDGQGCYP
mmetsp:Transcript_30481/g.46682  ORF Transcript_30481/g.46682 Transcript_30481/m.46682 type:complete len:85 (+) Transcript_30481:70-324(+)